MNLVASRADVNDMNSRQRRGVGEEENEKKNEEEEKKKSTCVC